MIYKKDHVEELEVKSKQKLCVNFLCQTWNYKDFPE